MHASDWRQTCYPFDLGSFTREVSLPAAAERPAEAKLWFTRGMIWYYAFNREEATACFKEALRCAPSMAMAHWGIAISNGVNYNQPQMYDGMVPCRKTAFTASRRAHELRNQCTEVEQALIDALQCRYSWPMQNKDLPALNTQYADAMKAVYQRFPTDADVACLYVEACMLLRPWSLWDIVTGEPQPRTLEIKEVLERALEDEPNHPGLTHLYIHVMEMSPQPEVALDVADRIYTLVPDSGHMIHMATHIYMPLGFYEKSIQLNQKAIEVDRKYMAHEPSHPFYRFYIAHNWHFIVFAAMMEGKYALARSAAEQIRAELPHPADSNEGAVFLEMADGFSTMLYHVLMRFGKWDEILSLSFPQPKERCLFSTATLMFTQAIALASLNRVNEALDMERRFLEALNDIPPSATFLFNNCRSILNVGKEMLRGEITYRQGDYRQAFEHLRKAVQLEDSLQFDEPWAWMQPVRHALGALLLEQGRLNEAEEAFRQDLSKRGTGAYRGNPNNIWSLVGMQRCLERQGRTAEAQQIASKLKKVREVADTPVRAPCYCARELINEST